MRLEAASQNRGTRTRAASERGGVLRSDPGVTLGGLDAPDRAEDLDKIGRGRSILIQKQEVTS